MVSTLRLYEALCRHNIELIHFPLEINASISHMDEQGQCYIGLDPKQIADSADERVKLAHEIGHCATAAFYNRYSKLNWVGQQEHRADRWAVDKLLPWEALEQAMQSGLIEVWQLAEHFDVTEDFVRRALALYAEQERCPPP